MKNAIKIGIYAAAGVGVFTILKRYGVLDDLGRWLSDQVPEDYKRHAAHAYKEAKSKVGEAGEYVKDQAGKLGEQVKDRVGDLRGQAKEVAGQAKEAISNVGQNFAGKAEETVGSDGSSGSHRVGRGVTN